MERAVLRTLDANANRAREGLRVLEDVARFVLDDASLAAEAKSLRHAVTREADALRAPAGASHAARDSEGDVGRPGMTEGEGRRSALGDLVLANARRAEEALRVLEEFSKLSDRSAASRLKDLRYSVYTLEQRIVDAVAGRGESG